MWDKYSHFHSLFGFFFMSVKCDLRIGEDICS